MEDIVNHVEKQMRENGQGALNDAEKKAVQEAQQAIQTYLEHIAQEFYKIFDNTEVRNELKASMLASHVAMHTALFVDKEFRKSEQFQDMVRHYEKEIESMFPAE